MKKLVWIVAALMLISCGDTAEEKSKKDPANVNTNESVNNEVVSVDSSQCASDEASANVGGQDGCYKKCDSSDDCEDGDYCHEVGLCAPDSRCASDEHKLIYNDQELCVSDCQDDEDCDGGFVCDANIGLCTPDERPSCDTRADCSATAECKDGTCIPHQFCEFADWRRLTSTSCRVDWYGCTDQKAYTVYCEGADAGMSCTCIVNDVETTQFNVTGMVCGDVDHRFANENCGWSLPYAD